jgi:hypothetical protein
VKIVITEGLRDIEVPLVAATLLTIPLLVRRLLHLHARLLSPLLLALPLLVVLLLATNLPAGAKADQTGGGRRESLSFSTLSGTAGIVGLNYVIGGHGYPVVSDIYKGGPADKAGIKTSDEILAVGDNDTRYVGYLHLQPLLTGESGTKVSLKIRRSDGDIQTISIVRAAVESFKDPNLHKYEVAKWQESDAALKEAGAITDNQSDRLAAHQSELQADHQSNRQSNRHSEHLSDQLIDLPFSLLSREHNRPTLFEFAEKESDKGVLELLKKHSDGSYILNQCKIVRIRKDDPDYGALYKYLGLTGSYALVPVYQPWLVTVKESDIFKTLPTEPQLNSIAKNLVHSSIRVQVSHTVAQQKGNLESGKQLNKRVGLSHKTVLKRICQVMPAGHGIVGIGFASGPEGNAAVTQVFAQSPAEKAGIKRGDQILEVDGEDTRYLGLEHIQSAFTGPVGKTVTLQIRPAKEKGKSSAAASQEATKEISLSFEPLSTFNDPNLTKITVSKWQHVISSNSDDSDEYELPCCMLASALDRPTIFEFCNGEGGPSVNATVAKLREAGTLSNQKLQVVIYTPKAKDYEALRKYFNITSNYACLPVYYCGKHKTFKTSELLLEVPTEKELHLAIEKVSPTGRDGTKVAH